MVFNPDLPLAQASTIPSKWYWDTETYEKERVQIFTDSWQCAGRKDQVASPGNYFAVDLAGEPVAVVRDREEKLRAFTNICRHRAAHVIPCTQGKASFFQCRYHGWTYDLAGRLKGTPEFDGVQNFSKEENGLPQWHVDTWGPLVFVCRGKPRTSLDNFLGPLVERTSSLPLSDLKFVRREEYPLKCNWKVFVDNYLDGGYHINTIHPALAGVMDYSEYRIEVEGNTSLQWTPLKPPDKAKEKDVAQVRTGTAYYWWIYPNLMINIYDGVMDTNLVIPTGPETCTVLFDYYFTKTDGGEIQRYNEQSMAVAQQVQLEDLTICEDVQKGLHSHSYSSGRFSAKREAAAYHFHQMLAKDLLSNRGNGSINSNA